MNNKHKTFNEREIDILNEISDENTIYEETQCGPQEEPIITELKVDTKKWKMFKSSKKNK
jgi:hypothetical protein